MILGLIPAWLINQLILPLPSSEFETWKIIVIVVAVVVVAVLVIGCYCYRRKKQLAQMNAVTPQQQAYVNPSSNVIVDQNIPYAQQQGYY